MTTTPTRLDHLQRQITRLDRRIRTLNARSDRFVRIRVGIIIAGLIVTFLAFSLVSDTAGYSMAGLTLIVFLIAAHYHRQVKRSIMQHHYWWRLKVTHHARVKLDWSKLPQSRATAAAEHPFAHDLDIVGTHSLHRLLNTAASDEGGQRLADWLLATEPDPQAIAQRQTLVAELQQLTHFRDRLTLNGWLAAGSPETVIQGDALLAWFQQGADHSPSRLDLVLLSGLALVNAVLFIAAALDLLPAIWPITFLIYTGYSLLRLRDLGDLFGQSMALRDVTANLHGVFRYLENYAYATSPALKALCAPFLDAKQRPSAQLAQIGRIVTATSLRGNPILWTMINAVVPWDLWFAAALARKRAQLRDRMPQWLHVWYELEALSSLATFGWLNPAYTRPIITDSPRFEGVALGHPLIVHTARVCNDFTLGDADSLVIITGSNMAGKSSFLRTLGVNLALAYAGGPVNAQRLETGLFRVFATIRINDSVTEGYSYFYAEVRRLKALLTELERPHAYPLFFLIDEIFKGTNNQERLIGSRAYIRALAGRNGIGAISTHDLELTQLADEVAGVRNQHFREEVVDGEMIFDYQLRAGPCPTTNALKIMALAGLPVDDTKSQLPPQ
ncbi:MAG: hypothetical protein CL610_13430 [Anaerolineaceae bacterium]|nr:hypothetical protein [Anaerolineaceae bacterium]